MYTYPEDTPPPRRGMSDRQRLVLTCGLLTLFAIGACCLTGVLLVIYAGQEPPLKVLIEYPQVVRVEERFDLTITIENTGANEVTVGDIDLDELMAGSIMDGALVESTEPVMERDFSIQGVKTFKYDRPIPPGEKRTVVFHMQATTAGDYSGSIGVYVGTQGTHQDTTITVLP